MALEMKQQEYIDDRINNEPVNIKFKNTFLSIKKDTETRREEYEKSVNKMKDIINKNKELVNNTELNGTMTTIETYLKIVKDEPETKTYYLNEIKKILDRVTKIINPNNKQENK